MLRASVRALVGKHAMSPAAWVDSKGDAVYDTALWTRLVEQIGGAAVAVPEEFGGAGGRIDDTVIMLEELGGALAPTPMLGTAIAAAAVDLCGDDPSRARLLPRFAEGATGTVVVDSAAVVDLADADIVLGAVDGRLVEYDPASLSILPLESLDPSRSLGAIELSGADGVDLGPAGEVLNIACLLAAAEQVGAAKRCLERTIEYTLARVQFGRAIGSFQALKHRMADLHVEVEAARALVHDASSSFRGTGCDAGAVAAASVAACEALTAVAGEAVQMHGGIGVTWEHDVSWYFKRAHGSRYLFGTPRDRMSRLVSVALADRSA
jgi:alkylation response protein AidB-like acyl-CoA dehydrogenase